MIKVSIGRICLNIMKIIELRTLLKDKDAKFMKDALLEVYKLLSKDKKQEADRIIESILSGKGKDEKKKEIFDLEKLMIEIHVFTQQVYDGLYINPNKIISKSERSKWRFKVKKYIKELSNVSSQDKNYSQAVLCLEEIYKMLSYGCGCYIFSTDDPFYSVGMAQEDLLRLIVIRKKSLMVNEEEIKKMIYMACTSYLSRECLHKMLIRELLEVFRREKYGYIFMKVGKNLVKEYEDELENLSSYDRDRYSLRRDLSEINNLIFAFSNEMNREDMDYYFNHSHLRDDEIALYILLDIINRFGIEEKWIEAYEYGISKGIEPRDSLVEEYQSRLEENN